MPVILFKNGKIQRRVTELPRPPAPRKLDREACGLDTTNWFDSEKGELVEINKNFDSATHTQTIASSDIVDGVLTITYDNQPLPQEVLDQREQSPYKDALSTHLQKGADLRGYDSIHTASSRGGMPDSPFQPEGAVYAKWMDDCNGYCYTQLRMIKDGSRTDIPTPEELIAELPVLVLPPSVTF